jgi:hypothetical protein
VALSTGAVLKHFRMRVDCVIREDFIVFIFARGVEKKKFWEEFVNLL